MREKLTPNQLELLKLMADGKKHTTADLSKKLKWKAEKVRRVRLELEQKGLVKKQRFGNVYLYSIIFASASVFLVGYGIMREGDVKLKNLILQEQQQRISADRYLDQRITTNEASFITMINEMQKEQDMTNVETANLIYGLQNEDSFIKTDILRKYNLTQSDINNLRQTVDLNDLFYNTQFTRAGMERAGLLSGLTREQQERLYGERRAGERMGYIEQDIGGLRGSISDIYGYLDEDDDKDDDEKDDRDNDRDDEPSRTGKDYFETRDIPQPGAVYTAPTDPKRVTYVRTIR